MTKIMRERMNAPCGYKEKDPERRSRHWDKEYPGVDCDGRCGSCGWNPAEAKRRMTTGRFVLTEAGLWQLSFARK